MPSEWRVTSQYLNGQKMYAVYRLRNIAETDHSGNREYATGYVTIREQAEQIAESLNNDEQSKGINDHG